MLHFLNFLEIFEIHQYFLVKLLNALRLNTVELDQSIFGDYCFTATVHFRFQCESLKIDLVVY